MADNSTFDPGTGGDTYRSKDRSGVKTEIVAIDLNPAGAETLMSGAMPVSGTVTATPAASVVSTVNSTTSVLAGAAAFTGTSEEVKDYAVIVLSVFTDQVSATDGLSVQQSSNGTNWDIVDTYTIPASSGKTFTFQPAARYYRVVYTNGATLQTAFRLQTVFHYGVTKVSSQRPSDGYTNESDLEQASVFPMVFNGTTWDRARGDTANGLDVDVTRLPALATGANVIGALAANQSVNQAQVSGAAVSVNSGAKDAGTQRVILASDQTVVPVSDNASSLTVDAPVATPVFVRLSDGTAAIATLPVSLAAAVAVTDNSGSLTVDAPVGTPVFATVTPGTTGGWSKVKYAAQTTTVQTVKGTAGNFGGYYVYNPNASVAYVQVFDVATATTVTLGTTVPDMIFAIPAGSAANLELTNGVNMTLGTKLACTTTATGSTAPATGLDMTVFFK